MAGQILDADLGQRLLGVDYGLRRVGLALSDALAITAQPLTTLERRGDKHICRDIAAIVVERDVGEVVVGWPLDMDGTEGTAVQRVQAFADRLGNYLRVPITFWDERLTSVQAERSLKAGGFRRQKQRALIDQAAAALLLQAVLDSRRPRCDDEVTDRDHGQPQR